MFWDHLKNSNLQKALNNLKQMMRKSTSGKRMKKKLKRLAKVGIKEIKIMKKKTRRLILTNY